MGILNSYKEIVGEQHIKDLNLKGKYAFNFRYYRNQKGLSYGELSKQLNVSEEILRLIEKGQYEDIAYIKDLYDILD